MHASDFKKMILGASQFFDREIEKINALNVFPVPDGDTGTNMSMTLNAAVEGTLTYDGDSVGELSDVMATHALLGARGNSGVILSQILRGIARGLQKKKHISPAELSKAFQFGVVYAYKAVSTPVEGTILTVAREMARGIKKSVSKGENLYDSMEEAIKSGKTALEKTPNMLPALKEAGVVDAGGLGLLVFLEGCLYSMKQSFNEMLPLKKSKKPASLAENSSLISPVPEKKYSLPTEPLNLEYPYCTEVIIKNKSGDFSGLKDELSSKGDSLIVATDKQSAKVHIHTDSPDQVLSTALGYGSLHNIKIDNMSDQHEENHSSPSTIEEPAVLKNDPQVIPGITGVIPVSFGEGFRKIFTSLGAHEIVFGGQTMNPKVEDLINAVNNLPHESIILLPNNKNIIMVAEQAKELSDKRVEVLKTRTLPEGLAAMLSFNREQEIEENLQAMHEGAGQVKTGLITNATRDTTVKGREVKRGQYLGLSGDNILTAGKDLHQTALSLAEETVSQKHDIITIFYGQSLSHEEAAFLSAAIEEQHPSLDVELQYGGQPIYQYIFSIE
ncbi:MAG: DAK2 domain-containing protein [Bacillota bacterium]